MSNDNPGAAQGPEQQTGGQPAVVPPAVGDAQQAPVTETSASLDQMLGESSSSSPPPPAEPGPSTNPYAAPDTSAAWPAPDQATQVLGAAQAASPAPEYVAAGYQGNDYYPGYSAPSAPTTSWPAANSDGTIPPPPGVDASGTANPKGSSGFGKVMVAAVVTGLIAGIGGGVVGYSAAQSESPSVSINTGTNPSSTDELSDRPEGTVAATAASVLPSVVSLEVSGGGQAGSGSGFVIDGDGHVLTNNHVVEAAANGGDITVVLQDGTKLTGELVGRNADYDLAVVQIQETDVPALTIGNSESVVVGDQAIAIGSPLGLEGTVTTGIISALNRPVTAGGSTSGETSFISAIQTDAPINPGNSGGPLVNAEGQVIGVNSAIATLGTESGGQAGSIGLGFAIPINTAQRVATEIINTGSATTPIIGATIDFEYTGDGARVEEVTPGGPAEGAGVAAGDIIVEVNGERVTDSVELITAIRQNVVGDEITLTLDDGREISLTLAEKS